MGKQETSLVIECNKDDDHKSKDEDLPLTPGAMMFHQPHLNCYILSILGYGTKVDFDLMRQGLDRTLLRHPRFRSIQVLDKHGRGKWVESEVTVNDHIVIPDVSGIKTVTEADQFVEDYISDLSTTRLDFVRPLWDVHVLNVKTSEAESVAIIRIHHSIGDGVSLVSLLLASFRKSSDPSSLPTIPTKGSGSADARVRNGWVGFVWVFLYGLVTMVSVIWNTFVDTLGFLATSHGLKDTDTLIKGREGCELKKKRFVHKTVLLADVKAVKRAIDGTINDVLLGITSAGLTRYLCRRYEENGDGNLPKKIRLRSLLLVNVRKTPGILDMSEMMAGKNNKKQEFGNWIGYIMLPIPIAHHNDPLDYARIGKKIINRKKSSWEAFVSFSTARVFIKLFGIKKASEVSYQLCSNTTLSFSNIAGPVEQVDFCGNPLLYIAPTIYGHPHSLTLHFQSYMNKIKMVIAADETAIPDPHQLCNDISDSLDRMKNAIDATGN